MNILLPDAGPGPFPVYYLLHGLSDDHTIWSRRTSLERYVAGLPLIVVMPNVGRGWYVDAAMPPGRKYEEFIVQDVVGLVDRLFPTIKSRKGRVIGGLSMGGYGAVKLALKYPDMFCSANSHSGAVLGPMASLTDHSRDDAQAQEFRAIFGPDALGGPDDPQALAGKCAKSKRPALRLDCGREDFLLRDNRAFHVILKKLKFPHEYQEFAGGHEWGYWDEHVQEALAFHRRALGI